MEVKNAFAFVVGLAQHKLRKDQQRHQTASILFILNLIAVKNAFAFVAGLAQHKLRKDRQRHQTLIFANAYAKADQSSDIA